MPFIKATGILQLDFQVNSVLTYGDKACIKAEVLDAVKEVSDFLEWFDAWYAIAQVAEKEAEGGEQHCQVGNHLLAINYIIGWKRKAFRLLAIGFLESVAV